MKSSGYLNKLYCKLNEAQFEKVGLFLYFCEKKLRMNLKEMREYAGLTKQELADKLSGAKGGTKSYTQYKIEYMEGGHRSQEGKAGLNLLRKMANACGCEVVISFKPKNNDIQPE